MSKLSPAHQWIEDEAWKQFRDAGWKGERRDCRDFGTVITIHHKNGRHQPHIEFDRQSFDCDEFATLDEAKEYAWRLLQALAIARLSPPMPDVDAAVET